MKTKSRSASRRMSKKASRVLHKVFIVDDHPLIVFGVQRLLEETKDMRMVGSAPDFNSAIENLARAVPDIILVDISLRGKNGIELLRYMRVRWPKLPVLMLSIHDESLYAVRCLRSGAAGYLMKTEAPELLITAIRTVLAGEVYLSPKMEKVMTRILRAPSRSPLEDLSEREIEVFKLLGLGQSTKEIAEAMRVNPKTVAAHCDHIRGKLGLRSRAETMLFAKEWVSL